MSVESIQGDLLDFPAGINVIAHCSNCQGVMRSGIAKSIKERYPEADAVNVEMHKLKQAYLGNFSYVDVGNGHKIVNVYGQYNFGRDKRYLDYEGFYVAMAKLKILLEEAYKEGRLYVLGVPKNIGCGTAGGSWLVVQSMLLDLFQQSPIRLVIVELIEGKQKEPNEKQESKTA